MLQEAKIRHWLTGGDEVARAETRHLRRSRMTKLLKISRCLELESRVCGQIPRASDPFWDALERDAVEIAKGFI